MQRRYFLAGGIAAGSVWAAGVFHGVFNAAAGLTLLSLSDASFPWNGVVGIGGFVALGIGAAITFLLQRGATTKA